MRVLVGVCAYNENLRIAKVLDRLFQCQKQQNFSVVIVDDGSSDGTREACTALANKNGWDMLCHEKNCGVGATIRDMIHYGRENGYDILVTMSGNGKTQPEELHRMFEPVMAGRFDYVKGSRYLDGGSSPNLPGFRQFAIPLYSFLISVVMRKRVTDITCLINAMRLSIFDDREININQSWLDRYELEYYVLYYVLKKKLRFQEVPMTIRYPESKKNYSKIKPFSGWWSMIRPWVLLILRIKK